MIASVTRPNDRRRGAFTLLEVLVVVAILVILASVGTISVLRFLEDAKIDTAHMQMQTLQSTCKMYYTKTQAWPNGLQELCIPVNGLPALLDDPNMLNDPWGGQYQYQLRQNPVTGAEEPFISTVTNRGIPISWPKQ